MCDRQQRVSLEQTREYIISYLFNCVIKWKFIFKVNKKYKSANIKIVNYRSYLKIQSLKHYQLYILHYPEIWLSGCWYRHIYVVILWRGKRWTPATVDECSKSRDQKLNLLPDDSFKKKRQSLVGGLSFTPYQQLRLYHGNNNNNNNNNTDINRAPLSSISRTQSAVHKYSDQAPFYGRYQMHRHEHTHKH